MRRLAAAAGLVLAVAAVYLPGLRNGFVYDDHEVIAAQPRQPLPELARVFREPHFRGLPYYRPVTRLTLLAQKSWHGDRPWAYRAGNVGLAAAAALGARTLLRSPALGVAPGPAWLAAALFAVHPVASACVHPIASGRETLLPAVAILAALGAWVRGRRALAFGAFGLALFAKEQAVVVPALFLLADATGLASGPRPRGLAAGLRRHAPALPILAGYVAVRHALFGGSEWDFAWIEQPILPLLSYAYALQVAFAPFGALVYEPEVHVWLSPPRLAVAGAGLLGLTLLCRKLGAPPARVVLFWLGWWVVLQLPTANVLRQEAPFAERWTFLAWLALPATAAGALSAAWMRPRVRPIATSAALVAIALAAAVSVQRAAWYRDDHVFATQWLRTNPGSPDAHHALGLSLARAGHLVEALAHYDAALGGSRDPAEIQTNRAAALVLLGRPAEARAALEEALGARPDHPEAHVNLGLLLARQGRLEAAVDHYRAALRVAPGMAEAHNNLATALARLDREEEAERHLLEALRLRPDYADARRNLELLRRRRPPGAP